MSEHWNTALFPELLDKDKYQCRWHQSFWVHP